MYAALGRLGYRAGLPLLRRILGPTQRAYLILVCGSDILVVKNWLSRQTWQLPGGGRIAGETPGQTLRREMSEELGIAGVKPGRTVVTSTWKTDGLGFDYRVLVAHVSAKPEVRRRKVELVDAVWLPLGALNKSDVSPELFQALQAAGLKKQP